MKRLIMIISAVLLIILLFRPVYMTESGCDWVLLWLCIGVPFGIRRLFLMFPRGYDLGGTIGFIVFGVLISGLVGGFVFFWDLLSSVVSVIASFTRKKPVLFR